MAFQSRLTIQRLELAVMAIVIYVYNASQTTGRHFVQIYMLHWSENQIIRVLVMCFKLRLVSVQLETWVPRWGMEWNGVYFRPIMTFAEDQRHLITLDHLGDCFHVSATYSDLGRQQPRMLGIWARGLRPRQGPPLPGVTGISLRVSNPRRQQVPFALSRRDYRPLQRKADFGVILSLSSSPVWQINCRFNSTQSNSTQSSFQQNLTPNKTTKLAQFLTAPIFGRTPQNVSSLRKIFALAKPERKPLLIAMGLLLMSSAVSMSVPFTIGKLIDFFSSTNPVRVIS